MSLWLGFSLSSNFYLSFWTSSNSTKSAEYNQFHYLGIYSLLTLAYALCTLVRNATILSRSIHSSKKIHHSMLTSIIRAPINLFFDRVPIGRILNRFSKDLNVADTSLYFSLNGFLNTIFSLLGDIIICMYGGTFYIFPLVLVFFLCSYRIQRRYQALNRELVRLGKIKYCC